MRLPRLIYALVPVGTLLLTGCTSLEAGGQASAAQEEGWVSIFDGKSLNGWTPKIRHHRLGDNYRDTFVVRDGAIRVSYDGYDAFGGRFGHLFYRTPVSAFRIRFEYRLTGSYLPDVDAWQHSNSGLMFHAQAPETMSIDQSFPVSLEVQLLGADGDARRPTGNVCTPGTLVDVDGREATDHCILAAAPTIPNERWVQAEVQVDGDGQVTHLIDGRPVLRYTRLRLDPADADARRLPNGPAGGALTGGYLALQSEGHPIEFRNIMLKTDP